MFWFSHFASGVMVGSSMRFLKGPILAFGRGYPVGGEDDETPLAAAKRETYEETGIAPASQLIQLDKVISVPVSEFQGSHLWDDHPYALPQYCFGLMLEERELVLSPEHTEYCWLEYERALALLRFDGNKTTLWELNKRLVERGSE